MSGGGWAVFTDVAWRWADRRSIRRTARKTGPSGLGKIRPVFSRADGRLIDRPVPLASRCELRRAQAASIWRPALLEICTKPGNEVATLATSRISRGPDARTLAIAKAMAMR